MIKIEVMQTNLGATDSQLDRYDRRILEVLSQNGRIAITDLAKQIGLSKTPCQVRVKKLRDEGYILGFRAVLDPRRLALEHVAFVEVKLSDTTHPALHAFNEAVQDVNEVEQCHMIAGPFDYLLKVRTGDIKAYRRVLGERISMLPHVAQTSTFVSMESVKEKSFW